MAGRSACEKCGATIATYDLVPVFSYLALRGKCRRCGEAIGAESVRTEILAALIGAISLLMLPPGEALAASVLGWFLLPLAILDYRHLWLPDALVLALAALGMAGGPILMPHLDWTDRAIGALGGFLALTAVRFAYHKLRHREGMGAGDPKLFAAIGIWFGWPMLPMILLLASIIGLAHAAFARFVTMRHGAALPLGSYLALSALLLAWCAPLAR